MRVHKGTLEDKKTPHIFLAFVFFSEVFRPHYNAQTIDLLFRQNFVDQVVVYKRRYVTSYW